MGAPGGGGGADVDGRPGRGRFFRAVSGIRKQTKPEARHGKPRAVAAARPPYLATTAALRGLLPSASTRLASFVFSLSNLRSEIPKIPTQGSGQRRSQRLVGKLCVAAL